MVRGEARWSVCVGYGDSVGDMGHKEKQVDTCGCEAHVGHGAMAGSFLYKQGLSAQGPACRHSLQRA